MSLTDLFSSFSKKNTTPSRVVGIDVGASSMKVVELQDKDGVVTLTTYGELQLGPYTDESIGAIVDITPEKEQQALVDLLRESAVKATDAVFAMPLSSSFVTIMTITTNAEDEDISPRINVEARKYIPIPVSEVTLDWAEVKTRDVVSKTARDVLLAAIQNDSLRRFNTLLHSVKLGQPPTEIECFSTLRAAYRSDEPDVAVLDMGARTTKLYIAKDGMLQRMHRVKGGGTNFTTQIMTDLELSFAEAELLKRQIQKGDAQYAAVQKIQQSQLQRMLREFRQVIEEYEARSGAQLTKVYVTGGGVGFPGTLPFVQEALNRETATLDSFNKVAYPAFMEDMMLGLGSTFTVALGAALRSFE